MHDVETIKGGCHKSTREVVTAVPVQYQHQRCASITPTRTSTNKMQERYRRKEPVWCTSAGNLRQFNTRVNESPVQQPYNARDECRRSAGRSADGRPTVGRRTAGGRPVDRAVGRRSGGPSWRSGRRPVGCRSAGRRQVGVRSVLAAVVHFEELSTSTKPPAPHNSPPPPPPPMPVAPPPRSVRVRSACAQQSQARQPRAPHRPPRRRGPRPRPT